MAPQISGLWWQQFSRWLSGRPPHTKSIHISQIFPIRPQRTLLGHARVIVRIVWLPRRQVIEIIHCGRKVNLLPAAENSRFLPIFAPVVQWFVIESKYQKILNMPSIPFKNLFFNQPFLIKQLSFNSSRAGSLLKVLRTRGLIVQNASIQCMTAWILLGCSCIQ